MIAYPIIVRYSRRGHNKWVYDNYLYSPKGCATGADGHTCAAHFSLWRCTFPLAPTTITYSILSQALLGDFCWNNDICLSTYCLVIFFVPCINTTARAPCLEAFSNVDFMMYFPVLPIVFTSIANFSIFLSGVEALNLSLFSLSRYTRNPFLASFLAASSDLSMSLPLASCRAASLARLPCRVSYRADVRGNSYTLKGNYPF